jgi:hypothetical protein
MDSPQTTRIAGDLEEK